MEISKSASLRWSIDLKFKRMCGKGFSGNPPSAT